MRISFVRLLWLFMLVVSGSTSAQTIDSVNWIDGGSATLARITFTTNIRFLNQAPTTLSDLMQLTLEVNVPDEAVWGHIIQESKRLPGVGSFPEITLTFARTAAGRPKVLNLQFGWKVHVVARQGPNAHTIDMEFVNFEGQAFGLSPLPEMAESMTDRRYAVVLQTSTVTTSDSLLRIPAALQDYVVFSRPAAVDGGIGQALAVGYFKTQEDAESVRRRILMRFPEASILRMDPDLPSAATPVPPVPPIGNDSASVQVQPEPSRDNSGAEHLLDQAREAYSQQRFSEAADLLNRALLLPPNTATEPAQELIGLAWEGMRDIERARIEYNLYMRLYPNGEGAKRVAQRLIEMGSGPVPGTRFAEAAAGSKSQSGFSYSGGISQFYYGGSSKSESLINISAGIDQNTLSRTNQSALVTSLDLTGRYKSDSADTKIVLRGNSSSNFVATSKAQSSLGAAYLDYRNLNNRLGLRVGRQSAIAGSMFGLFDGISLSMPISGDMKLSGSFGVPANTLVTAPSQQLLGVMLEADNVFDRWGGSISLVDQKTEEISDRRAMGLEVRYFGEGVSVFSQMDYDLNFEKINAFTLQGSMQGPMDTSITLLVDDRKAPSLQLSDALISSGTTSLKTLLQLKSLAEVKELALGTAAQARQAMISVSRSLSPKWQSSADIRYSEIGELPAIGNFQAMPATGAQYALSFQLTGSNLYSSRDINGFNLSILNSSTLQGTQFAYNNLTGFLDNKASLEFSISLYRQTDNASVKVNRVSPGIRLSYKLSEHASLMGETIFEQSTTDGPINHDSSSAYFFYLGYRYDLY
jgi:tetratricopeptide (TPR) repeat protein